jgi:hypothetical protein
LYIKNNKKKKKRNKKRILNKKERILYNPLKFKISSNLKKFIVNIII